MLRIIHLLKKLLHFIGRNGLAWLFITIITGAILSVAEISLSYFLTALLGALGITDQMLSLPFGLKVTPISTSMLVIGMVVLVFVRGLSAWLAAQSAQVANELISLRLKLLLYFDVFSIRTGFASVAEINTKVNEVFGKGAAFCCQATGAIPSLVQVIVLFAFLVHQSLFQMMIGSTGLVLIATMLHFVNRSIAKVSERIPYEHAVISSRVIRTVKNWILLKALRTMDREYRHICASTRNYSRHSIRASSFITATSVLPQMLGMIVVAVMILTHIHHPQLSNLAFLSFLYLYMRFVQALSALAGFAGAMSLYFPQFRSSWHYFFGFDRSAIHAAMGVQLPEDEKAGSDRIGNEYPPPRLQVVDLSFQYPGRSEKALHGVSFSVEAGGKIAIVGPSGAGKSTLLALIMGVLKPTAGSIEIGRKLPEQFFAQSASAFGYVGAEPFLVEGTLRANLLYGLTHLRTDEELVGALEAAYLGHWFAGLEQGLEYRISENGEGLSSGQKQRLSLARAFVSNPSLLLLDEISANLDLESEKEIAKVIDSLEGTCTVVVVSHREGLIRNFTNRIQLG